MMTQNQIASLYQQTSAHGVSRVGLVVKLYDAILADLRQASEAIATGQIGQRVSSINHALLIIGELQGVLDFERGGQAATRLKGFYEVTRAMLVEASAKADREMIGGVSDLYVTLRQAWQQADRDVSSGKVELPASDPEVARRPAIPATANEPETRSSWWGS